MKANIYNEIAISSCNLKCTDILLTIKGKRRKYICLFLMNCHYYGKLTGGTYGCTAFKCKRKLSESYFYGYSSSNNHWTEKTNTSVYAKAKRGWSKLGSWLGFWY